MPNAENTMSQLKITNKFYEYIFKKKAEEKQNAKLEYDRKEMDEQHTQQNMQTLLINNTMYPGSTSIANTATPANDQD